MPKVRLPPKMEAVSMSKESKPLKPFAQTEREKITKRKYEVNQKEYESRIAQVTTELKQLMHDVRGFT